MSIYKSIINFLEYLEIEKGRSILTVKNYDHYLQSFASFAKEKNIETPEKIDMELIKTYRMNLNRSEIGKKTQNYYLIALRSFLKFLAKNDIKTLAAEKIELAKTDEHQIDFLRDNELEDLLVKPDLTTVQGRRDRAILDLLFSTGLRVSELCGLKKTDINLDRSEFSIKGKGGKVRVVFLDHESKISLQRYLDNRSDKSDYLFISYGHTNSDIQLKSGGSFSSIPSTLNPKPSASPDAPMTPRSVQRMIHKYAAKAGINKQVTPHTMRHTFATDLLYSGSDLRAVQSLLGHKNIATTQIYTHVTDRDLREVHQAFHGLRNKKTEEEIDTIDDIAGQIDEDNDEDSETSSLREPEGSSEPRTAE